MAIRITDDCTSCGACEIECPTAAIREGDDHYEVDPEKCDECAGAGGEACIAACASDGIVKM